MASKSPSPLGPNAVQPYRIHVSQKYLDLTRQKLALTRLPREPRHATDPWGQGVDKNDLEPLIDYWQEKYDWRQREAFYNENLPQFRAPINGTRVHFVHQRSKSANATPLLYAHSWPESFIGASKIIDALTDPGAAHSTTDENIPAFHVVVPSIPGFGFSDPVPEAGNNMHATAEVFDCLMKGLGYSRYLVHGTGWGFKICRVIALTHPESCIAIHTVNPDVPAPSQSFNYSPVDLNMSFSPTGTPMQAQSMPPSPLRGTLPFPAGERPQTVAYALSDSPSGLLAYVMDAIRPPSSSASSSGASSPESLRTPSIVYSAGSPSSVSTPQLQGRSPQNSVTPAVTQIDLSELEVWPSTSIIDWTMLYWLPGPEVSLRWLVNSSALASSSWMVHSVVPLGITHFRESMIPGVGTGQTPPQWAESYHRVAMVRRREGRVRFPAWERPAELVMDLREFVVLLGHDAVHLSRPPYVVTTR